MSLELILLALAMISLGLAQHPFVTYPLSLKLLKKLRPYRAKPLPARQPNIDFTICMCAYNEEGVIREKLQNLLALKQREPGLEILVYVDAASDQTAKRLRTYAPHIQFHVSPARHGKTYGMNLLASRATGDVILFTDANVMLDMEVLDKMRASFADPEIGCVCGNLIYTNGSASVTASTGSLYWRLEEGIKRLEQQTGSVMGADGSLFAIRRTLHKAPPDHIIDDMFVSFWVLIQGYRVVQSKDARAYEESASNAADEFGRKSRIACQAFNVHRLIWPCIRKMDALTVYKYVSHKLLRWLCIYFLALSGIFVVAALAVAGYAWAAAVLVAAAIIGFILGARYTIKPFSQIVDILTSMAGAGLGVWKSVRGESFQTWTPVASLRKVAE
ncbi:MAG TPA: glycosyltransferase [Steroidobacter sp.]|uniref:glycosyltransferase n=1 Tax=Steroidobacter sp. TaxID=1978227 RepID=UPI002EDB9327